jgi:uncharacterized protein (DUF1015 family)
LWVVDDPAEAARFEAAFQEVPSSYIADGHHRAAAYARVARIRRERVPGATGPLPSDRFLAVHFPAAELRILDYNRLVRDLHGLDPSSFLRRLDAAGFDLVEPWPDKRPRRRRRWDVPRRVVPARARPIRASENDPVKQLDVLLQDRSWPILGGNPRTDASRLRRDPRRRRAGAAGGLR